MGEKKIGRIENVKEGKKKIISLYLGLEVKVEGNKVMLF